MGYVFDILDAMIDGVFGRKARKCAGTALYVILALGLVWTGMLHWLIQQIVEWKTQELHNMIDNFYRQIPHAKKRVL